MDGYLFILLTVIAGLMQLATAGLGYRVSIRRPSKRDTFKYEVAFWLLGAAGFLATIGIAALAVTEKITPQWDYAYLVPAYTSGDKLVFFFKATNNLQSVAFDMYETNGSDPHPYKLWPLISKGTQSVPAILVPAGDWTFDIDALGDHGKILQRVIIEIDGGKPVLTFSEVNRKRSGIICQTPKREGLPLC